MGRTTASPNGTGRVGGADRVRCEPYPEMPHPSPGRRLPAALGLSPREGQGVAP
jgi:hypothetical protein